MIFQDGCNIVVKTSKQNKAIKTLDSPRELSPKKNASVMNQF